MVKQQYQILIIGGGTAGITVAAQLRKKVPDAEIAIVEPSENHYYQPSWTLVGGGVSNFEDSRRDERSVIPQGVTWIKDRVTKLNPSENQLETEHHGCLAYSCLVVAPGLVYDFSMIKGLAQAFEQGLACSTYVDPQYTWSCIEQFEGGNAVFTQADTPIKCGGAPQKIAYLAADYFQKTGIAARSKVMFATPKPAIFNVDKITLTLLQVLKRYGIYFESHFAPVEVDNSKKVIYFDYRHPEEAQFDLQDNNPLQALLDTHGRIGVPFDLLHIAPPQRAPKFVEDSVLADDKGWLAVDKHSLQHHKFANVFGLGDVAGIPTAKTSSAIKKQAPVVVDNVMKLLANEPITNDSYQGYAACPIITGYGKTVMAEFDYDKKFIPDPDLKKMLIFESHKESWRLWLLKKYGLPYMYWNTLLKGN